MSWHYTVQVDKPEDAYKALLSKVDHSNPSVRRQMAQANKAITEIIASEAFGKGPYNVTVSGHLKSGATDIAGTTLSVTIHSKN